MYRIGVAPYPRVDRTQLFDLASDPLELTNLAAQPRHAAKVAELTALLQAEMTRHADAHLLTVANPAPAAWTPPAPGAGKRANPKRKI